MPADRTQATPLTVDEINALTRRGVWSRLAFSTLVGAIACTVISWKLVGGWLGTVIVWEFLVRRALERWTAPASREDKSEKSLRRLAAVHAIGAAIYASIAALGFLSQTTIGAELAMGWIAGAAIHTFVYFSNRRSLLFANLAAPALVGLAMPAIAAGAPTVEALLSTLLTLTLVASASVFATDRNALLAHLASQINARRAAEEANAAKTQFLKTISHELRTPLNAVIGYSELLQEELSEFGAERQRLDAGHINHAGKQLLGLINDMLQLSQQEANAPLLHLDQIDPKVVLHEIETEARTLAAQQGNRLELSVGELPTIILDSARLKDCLTKLVSNACKFTKDGVITLRVWTEAKHVLFEVADTGIGIEPSMLVGIFEPLTQVDASMTRVFEGAGLGLAVARRNARLLGGDISAESTPGRGSAFTLCLPLVLANATTSPADKAAA